MSLDKVVSYVTLDRFPFVTEDGSWQPEPNVKRLDHYIDEEDEKARTTLGKRHEAFTPTFVEGMIAPVEDWHFMPSLVYIM